MLEIMQNKFYFSSVLNKEILHWLDLTGRVQFVKTVINIIYNLLFQILRFILPNDPFGVLFASTESEKKTSDFSIAKITNKNSGSHTSKMKFQKLEM
ncbi:hypothetical protein RB195_010184 [Necator americanus]|uniref:Uncharacterized protein n=1 Tax=Necator americanus TaxID=51031 RepID=A0ABR1CXK1_NECAM